MKEPMERIVSVYAGITPQVTHIAPVSEILSKIKSGAFGSPIKTLRTIQDEEKQRNYKQRLPAITFGGTFKDRRSVETLLAPSCIIVADLDHVEHLDAIWGILSEDPYILFMFRSPSGTGIKVGFHAEEIKSDEDHKRFFAAMKNFLSQVYGLGVDEACKDISRLCFVSDDPRLYINKDAQPFDTEKWLPDDHATHVLPPPPKDAAHNSGKHKYGAKVLASCCERIAKSEPGNQHYTRLAQARLIGGFIASGYIDEALAVGTLEKAVLDSGVKNIKAALKTVDDGIGYGKLSPCYPSDKVKDEDSTRNDEALKIIEQARELAIQTVFPYQAMKGAAGNYANIFAEYIEPPQEFMFMSYLPFWALSAAA